MPSIANGSTFEYRLGHLVGCGATNMMAGNCGSALGWLCDNCRTLKRLIAVADAADDSWQYMASDWHDGMVEQIHADKDEVALRLGRSLAALEELCE